MSAPATNILPTDVPSGRPARIEWVDLAKGFGIILVVLGHVIRGLTNSNIWIPSATSHFIDGWIYAFHMPLFFFLSGLFLTRSTRKTLATFVTEKLSTIAYPYFVWSVITILIKAPLSGITNRADGLAELPLILYMPIEQYWFLYVLFVLSLSIAVLLRLRFSPWVLLVIAIIIYPGVVPISNYGWVVFAEASTYAIYITLGVIAGSSINLARISNLRDGASGFVVSAGLIISSLGGIAELPYRDALAPFLAIAGTFAVVALAVRLDASKLGMAVRLLGRHSLEIYVAHTIASASVRIALVKFGHVTALAPHLILGTLAGLYLPLALALVLNRIGFRYAFNLIPAHPIPAPVRDNATRLRAIALDSDQTDDEVH